MKMFRRKFVVTVALLAATFAASMFGQQNRAIMDLLGRTDASLNLYVRAVAAGAAGQTRAIGNLLGRTDANLNLYVVFDPTVPQTVGTMLFADGTAALPSIAFASEPSKGLYSPQAGQIYVSTGKAFGGGFGLTGGFNLAGAAGSGGLTLGSAAMLSWTAGHELNAADTILTRDAANTLALKNGVTSQTYKIYKTWVDASNYENLVLDTTSGVVRIYTSFSGTGLARSLQLGVNNGTQWNIDTSGHFSPILDNTYNNGDATHRIKTGYFGTSVVWGNGVEPTCNATNRGAVVMVQGGAAVKDTFRICAKDATDAYAYRTIY